jgi:hypothetical protein
VAPAVMGSNLMCSELHEELFSTGRRFWCPDRQAAPDAAEEWALSRRAMDEARTAVRVVDLPPWFQGDSQAVRELLTETCIDPADPGTGVSEPPGISGIEIGHDTYQAGDCSIRWRRSPNGERLCGQVLLARLGPECFRSLGFRCYLLRLNWSIRFTSITCFDEGIAARVVLLAADERWHALASRALAAAVRHLQPQIAWWSSPPELLADLFESVGIGVVS